ncbi:MAG: hypothetical protein AAF599_15510 [Bacteroidota bacterium]
MGHEKHKDRLEEIFAQKLDQASSEPNLWSTPTEEVWLGVDAELRRKRRDRRVRILLLFLFGVMLVFFLFGNQFLETFWQQETTEVPVADNLSSTPSETLAEVEIDSQESEEQAAGTINFQEVAVNTKSIADGKRPPNTTSPILVQHSASNNSSTATISDTNEASSDKVAPSSAKGINSELSFDNAPEEKKGAIEAHLPAEVLEPLNSQLVTLLNQTTQANLFEEKVSRKEEAWIVETSAGTYNSLRRYPIATDELNLEITPTQTYAAAINVEKVISSNWSVGLGLGYSKASFDANYDVNFAYSSINEQETSEGFEKAYQHSLPSLLNPLEAEFVLVRSRSASISTGDDIPLSLRLSHGTQQLSLPFYAKYRIHRGNWSYYLKAGVAGNMLLSDLSTDHITTESHHEDIDARSSSFKVLTDNNPIQQNEFSLSFLTSIGAQLHLRNNFYLMIEPTFSGEIIATYPDAATGDKIINLGGQIGIGKLLE